MRTTQKSKKHLRDDPHQINRQFINQLDDLMNTQDCRPFQRISPQAVQKIVNQFFLIDEEGQRITLKSNLTKLRKFGPGVYLMFAFLKYMVILLIIATILSLALIIMLLQSPFYRDSGNLVRISLMRLTIASLQPQLFNIYLFLDLMITLLFLVGLIVWNQRQPKLVEECVNISKLPSYLTVVIKHPKQYSQDLVRSEIQKQLNVRIHEVYTARKFGQSLEHYKQLTQQINKVRVLKDQYDEQYGCEGDREDENIDEVVKYKMGQEIAVQLIKLHQLYAKVYSKHYTHQKYQPHSIYVMLKSYWERDMVLMHCSNHKKSILHKLRQKITHQNTQRNNQILDVKQQLIVQECEVEPEAIAWENIGLSFKEYMVRSTIVFLILGLFVFLGCACIFLLQILETACIGDAYYFSQNKMSKQELEFCMHEGYQVGDNVGDKSFHPSQQCQSLTPNYLQLSMLILLTPFAIFLCKKSIMALLSKLVHFRKYPSQVYRIQSQTIILTIFYFIVSSVLHLCLYLKAKNGSQTLSLYEIFYPLIQRIFDITNYSPASIHLYSDFSLDWYKQATFFIILIGSTSFNISNAFKLIIAAIKFSLQKKKALKSINEYDVKKNLKGIDLHFEAIYASCITISLFMFLYGVCIPIVIPFALINMVFLLFVSKWCLVKYGNKPIRIGHSVSSLVTKIMLVGVIIHCIISPIFLGAAGIGRHRENYILSGAQQHQQSISILKRFHTFGLFYIGIIIITILYLITGKKIINGGLLPAYFKIVGLFCHKQEEIEEEEERRKQKQYREYYGLYPSYSMHNIEFYEQILRNIYIMNHHEARRSSISMDPHIQNMLTQIGTHKNMVRQIIHIFKQSEQKTHDDETKRCCCTNRTSKVREQIRVLEQALNNDQIQTVSHLHRQTGDDLMQPTHMHEEVQAVCLDGLFEKGVNPVGLFEKGANPVGLFEKGVNPVITKNYYTP